MKLKKPWTIYCLHHSHTDIGYTAIQEEIEFNHIKYIHEVVDILNQADRGKDEWKGFKWNCESFWCVEKFLENATKEYVEDFCRFVKEGKLGLSGSYLNLTELVSKNVLDIILDKSNRIISGHGLKLNSAMNADINGFGWGTADVLSDHGINNLLTCIHTHHGYVPTFEKQNPFFWVSPEGKKLFVWNGEHYMLGTELGFSKSMSYPYTIRDDIYDRDLNEFERAEARIFAYLNNMEEEDYPYDFIPITVSGIMTDNAPPSVKTIEFINEFNKKHGDQIFIKMATLDEFFEKAREFEDEIPEYSGDWADWWADGIGSTPNIISHYKDANRNFDTVLKLDPKHEIIDKKTIEEIAYNLIFYSEHTWGYSTSVNEPWDKNVNYLDLRKNLFAQKANELASTAVKKIEQTRGRTPVSLQKDYRFKAINPHNIPVKDMISLDFEILFGHKHFVIVDEKSRKEVPFQLSNTSRGYRFNIFTDLGPKEEKVYVLKDIPTPKLNSAGRVSTYGADLVYDMDWVYKKQLKETGSAVFDFGLENKFFRIKYEEKKGITSIYDKVGEKELIKQDGASAMNLIYEVTPTLTDQSTDRRLMGRNRKAAHTKRYEAVMRGVKVLEDGPLFSKVELGYQIKGLSEASLIMTVYKETAKIDFDIHFHKESVWNPENLYLTLPFTSKETKSEVWADKTGCIFRPRIDQIYGTGADFYLLQNGLVVKDNETSLLIGLKDTPLVTMGDLKAKPIKFHGEEGVNNNDIIHSWIMNNFWETNFKATAGGFHQYSYSLTLSENNNEKELFDELKAINDGVIGFYMFDLEKHYN